jgi:hypothetical protein
MRPQNNRSRPPSCLRVPKNRPPSSTPATYSIENTTTKCPPCTNPPQIGSWNPETSSFVSTWATLSEQEVFERSVYWLNEMLLSREEEYKGNLADWEASLLDRREIEDAFDIPALERTFGYDPAGVKGNFLTKVSKANSEWRKCGACKEEMGNVMVRQLPCGCVLHLKCLQRWFAVRKCCPCCGVDFKLIKIPRRQGASAKGADYFPVWDNDGYFNFI